MRFTNQSLCEDINTKHADSWAFEKEVL